MLCEVRSLGLSGISGYEVRAECDLSAGLPAFEIVGLPDAAVKEARDRVRAAIKTAASPSRCPASRSTWLPPTSARGAWCTICPFWRVFWPPGTAQAGRAGQRLRGGAVFVRLPAAGGGHAAHGPGRPEGGHQAAVRPRPLRRRGHSGRRAGGLPGGERGAAGGPSEGRPIWSRRRPGRRGRTTLPAPTLPT